MENGDLKSIWNTFDENLNSIEKTEKHILKQMISRKSELRLQIMKFQGILSVLTAPLLLIFIIIPMIMNSESTPYLIVGVVLITAVFIFGVIQGINYYKLLNLIRPAYEPVIKTQERILALKKFMVRLRKYRNFLFPVLASAFVLVLWDKINYELHIKIALLIVANIAIYFWGNLKYKLYFRDRIDLIELEMNELKDCQ